jgi:hypothetical protein
MAPTGPAPRISLDSADSFVRMTEAIDHEVPAGAIAAALAMIEALHDRDPGQSDDDLQDVVRAELDRWGRETLTEAFMMLIGVGISLIQTPKDEPHVKYRIIGAVVSNFHQKQLEEVPDFMLPTVAGALTAAVLDKIPICGVRSSVLCRLMKR